MEEQKTRSATVIYINSEVMGSGDDSLGALLMGNFLSTAGEFVPHLSHILLVNGGVKLACEGSDKLDLMQMLTESGVEILSCGTCLNHFELQEKLQAGASSNMFTILDTMNRAERIITP